MRSLKLFVRELSLWPSRLQNPDWDGRGAGVALVALVALFYVDKLVLGPWAAIHVHDVFDCDYYRFELLGNMVSQHGMVSWFPIYAGGIPASAWHYTPYFIFCLLARFLPLWLIYGAVSIGLMAASGWGMFRLLKERMGLSARTAFLGAAFFELITQLQPNTIPQTVFNYVFPLFYVWSFDIWENRRHFARIVRPLAGILVILMLAYPILTLPYFALLQFAFLGLDEKVMRDRRKLVGTCLWLGVLWLGYALSNLPSLYVLFGYAPEAARHFDAWQWPDLQGFREFLATLGQQSATALSRTLTIAPVIAAAGLLAVSARLRKCFWIGVSALVLASFFYSPLARVFAGTLIAKMDLSHLLWVVPFVATLVAVVGLDEIFRHPEYEARCQKLLGAAAALLVVLTVMGEVSKRTLAVNLCLVAFLLAADRKRSDGILKTLSGFSVLCRRIGAGLAVVTVLVILFGLFRFRPCEVPNILLFGWLAWAFWKACAERQSDPGGWDRRRTLMLGTMGLLVLFSVRMCRFGGDESENSPYKVTMENYSFLRTLRTQEPGPWRAGAVGNLWPAILAHYGWETVDSRGPIVNGRYKDIFKRIVMPQLTEKKDEEHFDSYWYDLSLMNGNRKMEFNWPLLALANVKYLVSSEPSPLLQGASESVRTVPLDSRAALRAWADKAGAALPFLRKPLRRMAPAKFYYIYTLKETLPRGFLVHQAAVLKNDREVLAALSNSSIGELKDKVCFSESDASPDENGVLTIGKDRHAEGSSAEACTLTQYSPDRLEFRLSLSAPGALVVSNNYNRYWKATVNGVASKVFRADHAFQAVLLPQAGNCDVVLEYDDPWLGLTHLGIVAGILLVASPLVFGLRRGRAAGS